MGRELEKIVVWREAAALAAAVKDACRFITGRAKGNAANQMIRAAESIAANIAEGVGKGMVRERVRFVRIARSSGIELESHLEQARISKRFKPGVSQNLLDHTHRVRFLLRRFQEGIERHLD